VRAAAILLIALLAGCAAKEWVHETKSKGELAIDEAACRKAGAFDSCMRARGWREEPPEFPEPERGRGM
jgi:hypothetical protein